MSYLERAQILGISCDARGCDSVWHLTRRTDNYYTDRRTTDTRARAEGWSFWVNRCLFTYCPQHGPCRGSKLTELR
jgi:hypothetical protein